MNYREPAPLGHKFIAIAACSLPAVIFLLFPHDVISANVDRLLYNPRLALYFLAAFFVSSAAIAAACIRSYKRRKTTGLLRISCGVAAFLVVSDAIRPMVDAEGIPLIVPVGIDLLLAAALIFVLAKLPMLGVSFGTAIYVLVLILWTAYSHVAFVLDDVEYRYIGNYSSNKVYAPATSTILKGNVYHLILDSYPQEYFLGTVRDPEMFSGFTLYRHFNSNYPRTAASVPGMLRSKYLSGGRFQDFYERAPSEGVWKDMALAGVGLSLYPFLNGWCIDAATYCYAMENLFRDDRGDIFLLTTMDLWFLKLMPNSVRALLNPEGTTTGMPFAGDELTQGFSVSRIMYGFLDPVEADALAHLGALGIDYQIHGLKQFERLLKDEAVRPRSGQYVFWHGMFPHGPRVTNGECEFLAEKTRVPLTEAAACATRIAERLIARLRELDKLENSLVVIQSDHGLLPETSNPEEWRFAVNDTLASSVMPERLDPEYLFQLQNHDATIYSTYVIDLFSSALLLVKWPGDRQFHVSDLPVQNVDIAPTILRHFGLENPEFDGTPIQDLDGGTSRPNVFIATTRLDPRVATRAARYLLLNGEWILDEEIELDD